MNLLIVDDEYYSAEGTKKKIAQKGPLFDEIFCAYNMTQALEYLAGHSVAIMILDIEMPGGSGLELLDHIRQQGLMEVMRMQSWRHSRQITGRKVSFICGSCSGWIYPKALFPTGKRISSAN